MKEDELKYEMEGITRDLKEDHAGNISNLKSALDPIDELRETFGMEGEVNLATTVTRQVAEGLPSTSAGWQNWKAER